VLLGREGEQVHIDELLAAARQGRGGALVVSGEAGVGKSSLLEEAAARSAGFRVLRALGVPSEAGIPFAGLHALVWPLMGRLEAIPAGQAAALRTALGLGLGSPGDALALGGAVLSLLAVASSEAPVLCLVDDAQWLDTESGDALLFAARRLHADRVAMLFAVRAGEASLDFRGIAELPLEGLERAAARQLLHRVTGSAIAPHVAERLVAAVGGNPLALVELAPALTARQLAGFDPLEEPVRPTARIEMVYSQRVAALSELARWTLLVAAGSDTPALAVVVRAAGGSLAGLAEAEAAGLVRRQGGDLQFRHPLVRSAVYHGASEEQRRAAHSALADALEFQGDDGAAWHRALATSEPDAGLALALEGLAERAGRRGGMAVKARALARAASLSPTPALRTGRLLEAARAAYAAGLLAEADSLCRRGLESTEDRELRAELQMQLTWIVYRGSTAADWRPLVAEAERLAAVNPALAAELFATACRVELEELDPETSQALAEKAWNLSGVPDGPSLLVLSMMAWARLFQGERSEAVRLAGLGSRLALERGDQRAPLLASVLLFAERYEEAEEVVAQSAEQHRRLGASMPWGLALTVHAFLELYRGGFARAYALGTEALQLSGDRGTDGGLRLASLAWLEAVFGRTEQARSRARVAIERGRGTRSSLVLAWAHAALGLLELGLGRFADAVEPLLLADELGRRLREPALVRHAGDLVEALTRTGQLAEASSRLLRLEREADAAGSAWARAAASRCRALLAPEEDCDRRFREALDLCTEAVSPFERARTELAYGERLRRLGQRTSARRHLRMAAARFELLNASPWAERARQELRGSGETLRARGPSVLEQLTPQEFQVSLLAVDGATNQEIASRLFLSPRTVESHLGNVYRKLGLRSKAELAARFREQPQSWSAAGKVGASGAAGEAVGETPAPRRS
jgi:DNA-binding CsgD family transcriptional regulator